MKYLTYLLRFVVGGFFIFSGYVKAVDPMGTGFKMEEYFDVFTEYLPFLSPLWNLCAKFALPISIGMIVFELLIGATLILGVFRKFTLWGYALLVGFFTVLTGFSAATNKVTDCGCFGDFLKLEPIQTFGKDVILCVLVLLLFFGAKYITPLFNKKTAMAIIAAVFGIASMAFTMRNVLDLPVSDWRPYAPGANICEGKKMEGLDPGDVRIYYTMVKTGTNESKEVTDKEYLEKRLYEDKTWEIDKSKTRKEVIRKPEQPKIKDFVIRTADDHDITDAMLARSGYQFIVSSYNFAQSDREGFKKIAALMREAQQDNVPAIGVSNMSPAEVEAVGEGVYKYYMLDATPIKTMMRSNPGVMLIKDCVVIDKWHCNHLPAWQQIKAQYNISKQAPPQPLEEAPAEAAATDSTAVH